MVKKIGTIITTPNGPSVSNFSFVLDVAETSVNRGQFVSAQTEEGTMIANVTNIYKTNRYFESAGAVHEYNRGSDLFSAFPVKEWEYTIADARALGVYSSDVLARPSFPPSPGTVITEVDPGILNKFLGLDQEKGIELGEVQQHDLKAKFNLTKMIQKHLAILAISGAGKSYATAVLIEELLNRTPQQGRIALLLIDVHGEYVNLAKDPAFKGKVHVVSGLDVKIGAPHMSEKGFAALIPSMSSPQVRELSRVLVNIKRERGNSDGAFDLKDIVAAVREDEDMPKATREALASWLGELEGVGLFSNSDWPNIGSLLGAGSLLILDLSGILELRKKQLIVNYLSRKLFNLRKDGIVPPYMEIIEEAHNFCPEGKRAAYALSRGIIEKLAREGRKFYANLCLISQRPIQLSTTALSQCNTQIIMRVTNPYDLDHIKRSSEAITSSTMDIVSSLKVGEALVIGEATNYPVFIKIRKRRTAEGRGTKLEDYAILYEKKIGRKLANTRDFM